MRHYVAIALYRAPYFLDQPTPTRNNEAKRLTMATTRETPHKERGENFLARNPRKLGQRYIYRAREELERHFSFSSLRQRARHRLITECLVTHETETRAWNLGYLNFAPQNPKIRRNLAKTERIKI